MKRVYAMKRACAMKRPGFAIFCAAVVALGLVAGCGRGSDYDRNMKRQPRYSPMEPSGFFPDGRSERPSVEGTVARGQLRTDHAKYDGMVNGKLVDTFPFPITQQVMERGQQRYNIYCSVCHGRLGDGEGMIVKRGFRHPPTFHDDRLRKAPVGHFYEVITHGYGAMFDYSDRVAPDDRWAIAAYIRALQLSQHADPNLLSPDDRAKVQTALATPPTTAAEPTAAEAAPDANNRGGTR